MKAGDLVQVIGSFKDDDPEVTAILGTVIKRWSIPNWWVVLSSDGELINWPEEQMSVVGESE